MVKKILYYFIILIIISTGCSLKTKRNLNDEIIIKYYTQTYEYISDWYQYKQKHHYFNKAPVDFNLSRDLHCHNPSEIVSKVYFRNKKVYKQDIPFKVLTYCRIFEKAKEINPESMKEYDEKGRIIREIIYTLGRVYRYTYKKNKRVIKTTYTKSKNTNTVEYIYDENKKLLRLEKYKNGKFYSIYKLDKKNKNKLLEYDISGKLTGDFLLLNEF